MAKQSHTQEPWLVGNFSQNKPIAIYDENRDVISSLVRDGLVLKNEKQLANAKRIVACVNACVGIPNDELIEIAAEGGMLTPRQQIADIAIERDELLAALKSAVKSGIIDLNGEPAIAIKLIARVEGK